MTMCTMDALTVRLWSFALLRTSSASFWEQFSKSDARIFVILSHEILAKSWQVLKTVIFAMIGESSAETVAK